MDKYIMEFCKNEGIDITLLDERQIRIIEKSNYYNGFKLRKSLKNLAEETFLPMLRRVVKLAEKRG